MSKKLYTQLGLGIMVGFLVVLAAWFAWQPYTYQGSLIDPPAPAQNFTLRSTNGTLFELGKQHGKVVLLFFGYTHCPDVCPTTLYDLAQVMDRLGRQAAQVQVVFITVDPQRDSLSQLRDYVTTFDPNFQALGGDFNELEPVWAAYGVYREEVEVGSAGGYLVDHTARVYVIDPQGGLRLTFPFGMPAEAMAEDLSHLIKAAN